MKQGDSQKMAMTFYASHLSLDDLGIVMPKPDDSVTIITIPTPRGWKCRRRNCRMKVKHSHGTWTSLK